MASAVNRCQIQLLSLLSECSATMTSGGDSLHYLDRRQKPCSKAVDWLAPGVTQRRCLRNSWGGLTVSWGQAPEGNYQQ